MKFNCHCTPEVAMQICYNFGTVCKCMLTGLGVKAHAHFHDPFYSSGATWT